jgi:hypothetical protein
MTERNLHTPVYKSVGLLSFFSFVLLLLIYSIVHYKNSFLKKAYPTVEPEGEQTFSILVNYNTYKKNKKQVHNYTYIIPTKNGVKTSITEEVDSAKNLQLRIGDTVETRKKTVSLFGKELLLSRIKGNKASHPNLDFLETFLLVGVYFALTGFLLSYLYKIVILRKSVGL